MPAPQTLTEYRRKIEHWKSLKPKQMVDLEVYAWRQDLSGSTLLKFRIWVEPRMFVYIAVGNQQFEEYASIGQLISVINESQRKPNNRYQIGYYEYDEVNLNKLKVWLGLERN